MSDKEYMERVRAMEERLYRIAQAILWRPADCADAVQEAVFRGWMKKGALRDAALFETWLIRILINECRDALKRRGREGTALPEALYAAEVDDAERLCENLALRAALRKLPEKYRLPLILHYMEGYPVKNVAEMLGLPAPRLASRLHQARESLRALLDGGTLK